jgi:outer membrane lipoprotein-sorting protein
MRQTIVFAIAALLYCGAGFSQGPAETKTLMDRVSKKLQTYQSVKIDFTFTLQNKEEDINDTQDGSLFLSGDKYRLKLMGILALCNGETLWTVNEELKEANIIDPSENEFFNPKSIFTLYDKKFKYEAVSNTGDKAVVDLIPLDSGESYSKIRMSVIKGKDQIEEVTYFSTDGNLYIIRIKSLTANVPADDRMFVFDAKQFPGVKVFDMR